MHAFGVLTCDSQRGKRVTVQTCKEFWLRCRGSEFDCMSQPLAASFTANVPNADAS
jgi:hypothetical protein